MSDYFILSLKHSPDRGGVAVWWGPCDCGYFTDIKSAGRYTQEQIDKFPGYYNNHISTIAVPVDVVLGDVEWTMNYGDAKQIAGIKPGE